MGSDVSGLWAVVVPPEPCVARCPSAGGRIGFARPELSGGREAVLVELEEVMGGGQQPPLRSDGRAPAPVEPAGAAVALDLPEDGLCHALAFEIKLSAPIGREHSSREVIEPAATSGAAAPCDDRRRARRASVCHVQ